MAKKVIDRYEEIKKLYIKSDLTNEEIQTAIEAKEADIKKKYPEWEDERILDQVFNSVYSDRKRVLTDLGGEDFILENHWGTTSFDWVDKRIKIAMAEYEKDPDKAIIEGKDREGKDRGAYVRVEHDKAGRAVKVEPLYYWKLNRAGENNKMLGQPLPESSYMRTIGGVAMRVSEGSELFKPFQMDVSGLYSNPNSKEYRNVSYNQMLDVSCGFVEEKDGMMYLKARSTTYFSKENIEYELDPVLIEDLYKDLIVTLPEIEEWFEGNVEDEKKHSRRSYKMVLSKCLVISIEPPLQNRSAIVYVDDRKRGLHDEEGKELPAFTCWWREDIPLDFGRDSTIYLFYNTSQTERKENNEFTGDWLQMAMTALGCIVLHRTEKEYVEVASDAVVTEEEFIPEIDTPEEPEIEFPLPEISEEIKDSEDGELEF